MNTTTFHLDLVSPTTGEFEIVIHADAQFSVFQGGEKCREAFSLRHWEDTGPADALGAAVRSALQGLPRGEDSEFSLSRGGDEVRVEIQFDSSDQDPLWGYVVRDKAGKAVGWDGALPDWGCAVSGAIDAAMAHWEAK